MAGDQEAEEHSAFVSEDSAQCLLPVVLVPPTVPGLQAQLVGHLLGLNTAVFHHFIHPSCCLC